MADIEPTQNIAKLASQKLEELRLKIRRDQESSIRWLTPEAHEDAVKPAKELFTEGMSLLGKTPQCQIETPEHKLWTLYGKEFAKRVSNVPENTDFLIYDPFTTKREEVNGEIVEYTNSKFYAVSPHGIVLVERNWANLPGKNGLLAGESRPPKGLGIAKTEVGKDEIDEILQTLRTRVNHFPNRG